MAINDTRHSDVELLMEPANEACVTEREEKSDACEHHEGES